MIKRSPRGKDVLTLLHYTLQSSDVSAISVLLLSRIHDCILLSKKKHLLPSCTQSAMWNAFHRLRGSDDVLNAWSKFLAPCPAENKENDNFAMQLVLDRVLKRMLSNMRKQRSHSSVPKDKPLTENECSAIRYMSGYVAVKLLKKYRHKCKNKDLETKYKLFVHTLEKMKASEQTGDPNTASEYGTLWMELIDRGGLYHIDDTVFRLMKSVEIVIRRHLHIKNDLTDVCLTKLLHEEVLASDAILDLWETIATDFPTKFERYSIELLQAIVRLWITIRIYSFAREFTKHFEKGTRKSLKQKSTPSSSSSLE